VADAGLIFVCVGCCCGRDGHGGALVPQRALRLAVTRAYKKSDLSGRVRLVFSDCLGPCSESNVFLLYLHGRPLWFRRMNTADLLTALMDYLRAAVDDPTASLPPSLAARLFSWTGGGIGPEPPIADTGVAPATMEAAR
jgi:(2Fe-2S) ferredoxin